MPAKVVVAPSWSNVVGCVVVPAEELHLQDHWLRFVLRKNTIFFFFFTECDKPRRKKIKESCLECIIYLVIQNGRASNQVEVGSPPTTPTQRYSTTIRLLNVIVVNRYPRIPKRLYINTITKNNLY